MSSVGLMETNFLPYLYCFLSFLLLFKSQFFLAPLQAFMAYPSSLNSPDIGSKGVARISNSGIDGIGSLCRTISSSELSKQGKPGSLFHGNLLNCIDNWFKLVDRGEVSDLQLYAEVAQLALFTMYTLGIPDFAEVYSFMGSVFDPDTQGHVQKLKEMDPINFETFVSYMIKCLALILSQFALTACSEIH
ncbi:hypothetical protein CsSME_00038465 [Camellia sinensis var. sinensis]